MRLTAISASLALTVSLAAQEPEFTSPKAQTVFEQFRQQHGGDWVAHWNPATGTPNAIYGTGLQLADWRENTLVEARRHALLQLEQHRDVLGAGTSTFQESIGARMGRTWSFVFDQYFNGLPVIDGRADVRINMRGVVAMLGSSAVQIPAGFDTAPALAKEVAEAAAWIAVGTDQNNAPQPGAPRAARLVIWADALATAIAKPHLAWEIPISNVDAAGNGPIGRYYIDAKTGANLEYRSDKHACGFAACTGAAAHLPPIAPSAVAMPPVLTTVTLQCWTRTDNDAFSALVNVPLPGVVLSVPGVGNVTTDQNGQFTIDIAAPVTINVGQLDGRHHAAMIGPSAPTGSFVVNPGVATTMQLSSAAATDDEAAHATTSWWVDRTNEFCRAILGNSTQLAALSSIVPTVNIGDTCNAFYTNNTINFFSAGGGCSNTAFSTVIAHEWGHGLDAEYGGIANHYSEGLSEGWGDIVSLYLTDDPVLGSGFQTTGVGIRNGNNTRVWPYAATTGNPIPPHPAGEVWMGFAWRLRENLRSAFGTQQARTISNDIVIGSIVADATTRVDAVREVFLADDDDGNLLNGTPHYAQLSAAAITKGIPYPEVVLGSVTHTPLTSTTQRLTPRTVTGTFTPTGGTFSQIRLHYNAGSGNQVRNMHPMGAANQFVALLPGRTAGPVTYHFEALHSLGYTKRVPALGEYSYEVQTVDFAPFYSENFDGTAPGWAATVAAGTGDWQRGDPNGKFGTTNGVGWIDPQNPVSGTSVYATDLGTGTSDGRYNHNVNQTLNSPIINCTGRTGVRLRFKRWLSVESGLYDQATVICNGTQIWANPTTGNLLDTAWQSVEYLLPMADNNPSVQVQWRLVSDGGVRLGGWQIDDVEIGVPVVPVIDAELRMTPEQAAQGATITLQVNTPNNSRPFLLALGDTAGPTPIPGFPSLQVGGATLAGAAGSTDASGQFLITLTAPSVPSTVGLFYYSQVLTFDAAFTTFVVSNPHINLFTQTP